MYSTVQLVLVPGQTLVATPVSSATATLTGLSPATTYQIRVQSGNGFSKWIVVTYS